MDTSATNANWRHYTRNLALPTLALGALVTAGTAGVIYGVSQERLPLWAGFILQVLLIYLSFSVMHEGAHRNINGRHKQLAWLNPVVGWFFANWIITPYVVLSAMHIRHHSKANHLGRDPDFFTSHGLLAIVGHVLGILPVYYREFFTRDEQDRRSLSQRANGIVHLGLIVGAMVGLSWLGYGREVLWLWLLPAVLTSWLLIFVFAFIPHWPHAETGRYRHARVLDWRVLDYILIGQNLHLIHHLWPKVPFYHYRACYEENLAHLRENDVVIIGRGAPPDGGSDGPSEGERAVSAS